jgi:hypothetical protein
MIGEGSATDDRAGRALADRLVATLGDRPFRPTSRQLTAIGGGFLVPGDEPGPMARAVAGRYAGLLTRHLVQDVTIDGAPEAYARIWLCARRAFLRSLEQGDAEAPHGMPRGTG